MEKILWYAIKQQISVENSIAAENKNNFSSATNVVDISPIEPQRQTDRFLRVTFLSGPEALWYLIQYLPVYT